MLLFVLYFALIYSKVILSDTCMFSKRVAGSPERESSLAGLRNVLIANCPPVPRDSCKPGYPYRVPDGTCNNPDETVTKGASIIAQPRILPNAYDDGKGKHDEYWLLSFEVCSVFTFFI